MTKPVLKHASRRRPRAVDKIAYGIPELAAAWGVSEGFLRLEIRRGKLNFFRAGRRLLIPKEDLDRYMNEAATK
jgi:excisionase family DNA binding protein